MPANTLNATPAWIAAATPADVTATWTTFNYRHQTDPRRLRLRIRSAAPCYFTRGFSGQ